MNAKLTLGEIKASQSFIGSFNNNWRGRKVSLYTHDDHDKVWSVGEPFNGGETIICEEPKSAYRRQLQDNDWSAYN